MLDNCFGGLSLCSRVMSGVNLWVFVVGNLGSSEEILGILRN